MKLTHLIDPAPPLEVVVYWDNWRQLLPSSYFVAGPGLQIGPVIRGMSG